MTTSTTDLAAFFEKPEIAAETYTTYADAAHASFQARERFEVLVNEYRERVASGQGDSLKLAIGLFVLGKLSEALEVFAACPSSVLRHALAAEAALGLNRFDEAIASLREAAQAGGDALEMDMRIAAVHLRLGDTKAAESLLEKHRSAGESQASWYYTCGLLAESQADREAALTEYERAIELDPEHAESMFRAARLFDLCGEDEEALDLYKRLTRQPRAHINALLNASVVYEDLGRYEDAMSCLRRVVKAYPNHRRARLFMKSVESCKQMIVEEAGEEPLDAATRLLSTPLSEYELTVRARNCLKKMNIRTLGELMRLTEAELLAYKNFGETSLNEIKSLLSKKGLRLGMQPEEVDVGSVEQVVQQKVTLPPGQEALLSKSVSELELSVRSRRCLQRLNVQTLADLVQYTESDLLATRNFGVTSLNEIKARLAEHDLQLSTKAAT
jgi:DNA-directed RNA polymerase subunit alpha